MARPATGSVERQPVASTGGHDEGIDLQGSRRHGRVLEIDSGGTAWPPLVAEPGLALNDPGPEVTLQIDGTTLAFRWGQPHLLGTCAYWVDQTRQRGTTVHYRMGANLTEEVVACLLGGFGVPAEVGLGAFDAVRAEGLIRLSPPPTAGEIENILRRPISVPGRPRPSRYRFPRQRAERISTALRLLTGREPPNSPLVLRRWLVEIPGIGPKTASWIVRNYLASDSVAIIDVHVWRAGLAAGFFSPRWRLPADYELFEQMFLAVARLGGVSAAALDACIWGQLHFLGSAGSILAPRRRLHGGW